MVTCFYGLYIHYEGFYRALETYFRIHKQLSFLDIMMARRRSNSQFSGLPQDVASRIPVELWREIKLSLIRQELDILEAEAKIGMGKSCRARWNVKLEPSDKWSCDQEIEYPYLGKCQDCREYMTYGFPLEDHKKRKVRSR